MCAREGAEHLPGWEEEAGAAAVALAAATPAPRDQLHPAFTAEGTGGVGGVAGGEDEDRGAAEESEPVDNRSQARVSPGDDATGAKSQAPGVLSRLIKVMIDEEPNR